MDINNNSTPATSPACSSTNNDPDKNIKGHLNNSNVSVVSRMLSYLVGTGGNRSWSDFFANKKPTTPFKAGSLTRPLEITPEDKTSIADIKTKANTLAKAVRDNLAAIKTLEDSLKLPEDQRLNLETVDKKSVEKGTVESDLENLETSFNDPSLTLEKAERNYHAIKRAYQATEQVKAKNFADDFSRILADKNKNQQHTERQQNEALEVLGKPPMNEANAKKGTEDDQDSEYEIVNLSNTKEEE